MAVNQDVILDDKAHKHLKDVLRMKLGDSVLLFNGNGKDYLGTINEISKKTLHVNIEAVDCVDNESHLELHLLQPLCKSEKMDLCIQKATELGVNIITPFVSSRVNINITSKRLEKKMSHWSSIIHSACEQSGRATLPTLNLPISFDQAINNTSHYAIKLIASPTATKQVQVESLPYTECVCAIGPEGGFSEQEIIRAKELGFSAFQIGPRILRLETAVISALTLCQLNWGDLC